jgi:chromosomal replication initiator protein
MTDQLDRAWLEEGWQTVTATLRKELGDTNYRSWITPISLGEFEAGKLVLIATSRFIRDWVRSNYSDKILAHCKREMPKVLAIDVIVKPKTASHRPPRAPGDAEALASNPDFKAPGLADAASLPPLSSSESAALGSGLFASGDISAQLDQRLTFESFVVDGTNELAYTASRRVAENAQVGFNPLFLYSGVGLGKTHLMNAIAWHIRTHQPERKVVYLTAEQFMFQFIRSIRERSTVAFKESFRNVDVLMIDDIQFIGNRQSTQEEFFHTFNALVDRNRQVVISADKSPTELTGMEDRLRSRLGWGLVADIHPTSYELRLGILQQKTVSRGVEVPTPVLEFLAQSITSNVRELEGALNRLVAHASLMGRQITIDTARELLADLLKANDRRVTIDDIQKRVATHFNMRLSDMTSARRARSVARPRQIAMYLSKVLTNRSLPDIGRKFGGRDHTTVMHAVRRVEELCKMDRAFREDVELLERSLRE